MKKITSVLTASLLLFSIVPLSGCGKTSFYYPDSEKYTAGGAEISSEISAVEIEWISGGVNVKYHEENTVKFSETANRSLTEANTLHYYVDGSTLRIKFAQSGRINFGTLSKTLDVFLPQDLSLSGLEIKTVSADISADGISSRNLNAESVSGRIGLLNCTISNNADLESVSGDIELTSPENIHILEAEAVSGSITVNIPGTDSFDISTVSANIKITSAEAPLNGAAKSTSGDIKIYLPENSQFEIDVHTVSGDFNSVFALTSEGNRYTCGAGANKYSAETVSGDISLYIIDK